MDRHAGAQRPATHCGPLAHPRGVPAGAVVRQGWLFEAAVPRYSRLGGALDRFPTQCHRAIAGLAPSRHTDRRVACRARGATPCTITDGECSSLVALMRGLGGGPSGRPRRA